MQLADSIVLDISKQTLTIDGQPFPWAILKDSVEVLTSADNMCGVRVTILANKAVGVVDPTVDA